MKTDPTTGMQVADCPETERHLRHMENVRGIRTTAGRREYIEGVRRTEGKFASEWIKDELRAEWAKEKV